MNSFDVVTLPASASGIFPIRLQISPNCFSVAILRTITVMKDGNGNERDVFVMVDQEGDRTLFKLVEVGTGGDVQRLARELHAPAVVVDMVLPALPALDQISETHPEHAESIARLVEVSAHEATRPEKRPEHLTRLSHELRQSVENFEASHPKLTAFVNEYSTILSALGI